MGLSRKNLYLMLGDSVGWFLGQSFLSPQTILPLFAARLTGSNLLIGMVIRIQSLVQLLPPLVAAYRIEHLKMKKRQGVRSSITYGFS
jgi:hypothetical protein